MKEKFRLTIESFHYADNGELDNVSATSTKPI